ncbi:hypothetical protein ABT095_20595 [Kitasatospora sp. NPDC002227]|uniref:hypothetical protein n=1 Tax=Kitasatospora sp. NPDC002227 TaxID=3154773 RepID=UPI00331A6D0F
MTAVTIRATATATPDGVHPLAETALIRLAALLPAQWHCVPRAGGTTQGDGEFVVDVLVPEADAEEALPVIGRAFEDSGLRGWGWTKQEG